MKIETGKDQYTVKQEFLDRTRRVTQQNNAKLKVQDCDPLDDTLPVVQWVKTQLAAQPKGRVLDYGCGYGRWATMLQGCYTEYLGIDSNAERIQYAQLHHRGRIIPYNPDFLQVPLSVKQDELSGNFPRFDTILSINLIQHLPLPLTYDVLRTMADCLAPGGVCLLWEGRLGEWSVEEAEARYSDRNNPRHMIPKPLRLLREHEPRLVWHHDSAYDVAYVLTRAEDTKKATPPPDKKEKRTDAPDPAKPWTQEASTAGLLFSDEPNADTPGEEED